MIFWDRRRLFCGSSGNITGICTYPNSIFFPILCRFKYKGGTLTITGKRDSDVVHKPKIRCVGKHEYDYGTLKTSTNEDDQIYVYSYLSESTYKLVDSYAVDAYLSDESDFKEWKLVKYNSDYNRYPNSTTDNFYMYEFIEDDTYTHRIANYSNDIVRKCLNDYINVVVNSGVTGLGGWIDDENIFYAIFKDVKHITSISLPETVNFVDVIRTFYAQEKDNNENLTSVVDFEKTEYNIGTYAFNDCNNLTVDGGNGNFKSVNNFLLNKDGNHCYYGIPKNELSNIPNTVSEIGKYAFAYRVNGDIDLYSKDNLSSINSKAFLCYTGNENITCKLGIGFKDSLYGSANSVTHNAFWGSNIETLYINGNVNYLWGRYSEVSYDYETGKYELEDNSKYEITATILKKLVVGETVDGARAVFGNNFAGASNLDELSIGNYVNCIDYCAFGLCKELPTLGFSEDLDYGTTIVGAYNTVISDENCDLRIQGEAYVGCTSLPEVIRFPQRTFYVGSCVLADTNVTDVTFGNCIVYAGYGATDKKVVKSSPMFGYTTSVKTLSINSNIRNGIFSSYRRYSEITDGIDYSGLYAWDNEVGLKNTLETIKIDELIGSNVTTVPYFGDGYVNIKNIILGRSQYFGSQDKYTPLQNIPLYTFSGTRSVSVYDTGNSDYTIDYTDGGKHIDTLGNLGFSGDYTTTINDLYIRSTIPSYFCNPSVVTIKNLYLYRDILDTTDTNKNISKIAKSIIENGNNIIIGGNCHSIPAYMFNLGSWYNQYEIKNVSFDSGALDKIYRIGTYAYANTNISNIFKNLVSVESYAFYNCKNLTGELDLSSCSFIGKYAFAYCTGITSVKLGNTYVSDDAFEYCTGITSISIENCKYIGDYAFRGCSNIDLNKLNTYSKHIGTSAFSECGKGKNVSVTVNDCEYIGGDAFTNCNVSEFIVNGTGSTVIGSALAYTTTLITAVLSGVKTLNGTFSNCTNLNSVSFDDNLKEIGANTFEGCTSLTAVDLPSSLYTIGKDAFSNCSALNTINGGVGLKNVDSGAFGGTAWYKDDNNWTDDIMLTIIPNSGFEDVVPNGWEKSETESGVVFSCSYKKYKNMSSKLSFDSAGLASEIESKFGITIDRDISSPFKDSRGNTYMCNECIDIPYLYTYYYVNNYYAKLIDMYNKDNSIRFIGTFSFGDTGCVRYLCLKDANVLIGTKLVSLSAMDINEDVNNQYYDAGVKRVFLNIEPSARKPSSSSSSGFDFGVDKSSPVYVQKSFTTVASGAISNSDLYEYIDASYWSYNSISLDYINGKSSSGSTISVTFTDNQESEISSLSNFVSSGDDCRMTFNIKSAEESKILNVGKIPIYIGSGYSGSVHLYSPHIVSGLSKSELYPIMRGKSGVTSAELSEITYIEDNMFYDCSKLESISFDTSTSIKSLGESCFQNCYALTDNFDFSGVNGIIPKNAFYNCFKVTSLKFGNISIIDEYAFYCCSSLKTISFKNDDNLLIIKKNAFYGCTNLKLNISSFKNLCIVEDGAFYGCKNLNGGYVSINDKIKVINPNAFGVNEKIHINKDNQKVIYPSGFSTATTDNQALYVNSRQTYRDTAGGLTESNIKMIYNNDNNDSEEIVSG